MPPMLWGMGGGCKAYTPKLGCLRGGRVMYSRQWWTCWRCAWACTTCCTALHARLGATQELSTACT